MSTSGLLVSTSELQRNLHNPEWRVVDCRFDLMDPSIGRSAWTNAHIPGAAYADLNVDLAGAVTATSGRHPLPEAAASARLFSKLGIGNCDRVVVYDGKSGAIAARAWWMLRWLGHEDVALLDGGYAAWVEEKRPLESGEINTVPRPFSASPDAGMVLTTAEIEKCVGDGQALRLVDARDAARFCGEHEPIDAIAGHIPGAINLPFGSNLRCDGRWKSREQLRALWAETVGTSNATDWGVMCGSGVTACHLVISACLAGFPEPRLYAGSWSEWIRRPDRPISTGS